MRIRLLRLMAWLGVLVLLAGSGGSTGSPVAAQVVRPWQDAGRAALSPSVQPFLTGLTDPVFMTHAGDGSGRLFVVERRGTIKVVVNGQVQPVPFLDLAGELTSAGSEQGLLGLAFHPGFATNGRFYVYYTPPPPNPNPSGLAGFNALAEFHVTLSGGNQADPTTKRVLLALPDRAGNHNGGMIAFGPDGYLYVGIGDEGGADDGYHNAQNLAALFGKLLRLDVDRTSPGLQYAIPPGNPFAGQTGGPRPEIWSLGLRNPWRFSFDRSNGDLWIGDVGQNQWEEVDLQRANAGGGQNYGWSIMEGLHCFNAATCSQVGLMPPVAEYGHTGGNCSITGGYVYRGTRYPALSGLYLYADWCSGQIRSLQQQNGVWSSALVIDTPYNITSFGEDDRGDLYIIHAPIGANTVGQGAVYLLADAAVAEVSCTPSPRVAVQTTPIGPGVLQVTLTASTNPSSTPNELRSIQFSAPSNARIVVGGAAHGAAFTHALVPPASSLTFTVQRDRPGAMTVPMIVTDACPSPWPTFVGAGPSLP